MVERETEPAPDALRAFLWGKRQSRRHAATHDVRICGTLLSVHAISLDISARGVLLRIPVEALAPEAALDDEVDPFLLVQTHIRGSCLATFKGRRVKAHLEVVRLDFRAEEPGFLFLGCRFARPLVDKQLKRFGLKPGDVGPEPHGLPSEMVPMRAADDPVVCRIGGGVKGERTLFEGRVLGFGEETMCVRVDGASVGNVASRLQDKPFQLGILEGDKVAWKTGAILQTIGFLDEIDALELGLVIDKAPGAGVRALFRAA